MKNQNLSLLDVNQRDQLMFDAAHEAQRVVIVGDSNISESIVSAVKESLKDIKVTVEATAPQPAATPIPFNQTEPLVIKIPYQTVVKETEVITVNVPTIVTEYKVIEVEKPIIITNTEVVTVEKQVIVTQVQYKEIPKIVYWLFGAQLFISLLTAILHK